MKRCGFPLKEGDARFLPRPLQPDRELVFKQFVGRAAAKAEGREEILRFAPQVEGRFANPIISIISAAGGGKSTSLVFFFSFPFFLFFFSSLLFLLTALL